MMTRLPQRLRLRRGFTLLELAVALAMSTVVVGAAMSVLTQVLLANRRQRIISDLQRDGEFASQLLTQEIRQAGLGVPMGNQIQQDAAQFDYGTGSTGSPNPLFFGQKTLLVARDNAVAILADLPRPDANYNLFGPIHNRAAGDKLHIAWHTENNGTCVAKGGDCSMSNLSMFFPGQLSCAAGSVNLTCPWASRRIAPNERFQIVDGQGNWSVTGTGGSINAATSPSNLITLPLAQSFDQGTSVQWANATDGDGPGGLIGQGWVTSLDRVFYDVSGTTLRRRQCWGDVDPKNGNWPNDGNNAIPANPVVTPPGTVAGRTASTCIGPEVIARNLKPAPDGFTLAYFDATGANVAVNATTSAATLNTITSVTWAIKLQKNDPQGIPVDFEIDGATAIAPK